MKGKHPMKDSYFASQSRLPGTSQGPVETFILKNKALRWDEQHNGWCPDVMGRVKMTSVKNLDLVAIVYRSCNCSRADRKWPLLQLLRAGRKDVFTMAYTYPLSAFQAFTISLMSNLM